MTRVVALVTDLMDRSRISGAVAGGVEVTFVADGDAAVREVGRDAAAVALVVVDLSRPGALGAVQAIAAAAPAVRMVGFGAHVQADLLDAGREGGCAEVLPRSRFFARLGDLLST